MKEKYQLETNSKFYPFEVIKEIFQNQLDHQFEKTETDRQFFTRKGIKAILDKNKSNQNP